MRAPLAFQIRTTSCSAASPNQPTRDTTFSDVTIERLFGFRRLVFAEAVLFLCYKSLSGGPLVRELDNRKLLKFATQKKNILTSFDRIVK